MFDGTVQQSHVDNANPVAKARLTDWCRPSPSASCLPTSGVRELSGTSPRRCSPRPAVTGHIRSGIRTRPICHGPAPIGAMPGSASSPCAGRTRGRSFAARTRDLAMMEPPSSIRTIRPSRCMAVAPCPGFPMSRLSTCSSPRLTTSCPRRRSTVTLYSSVPLNKR